MFTGLIQAQGAILAVAPLRPSDPLAGVRILVDAVALAPRPIALGASIAVNGVCLTVTQLAAGRFHADVSRETLSKTCGLDRPGPVNLETALALGEVLGGHLLTGHVDGLGRVVRWNPVGESIELGLSVPAALRQFLAPKGSVAVNGVSLTVNRVHDQLAAAGPERAAAAAGCEIALNLIPYTLEASTLGGLAPGMAVNLEVDLIARYVARMLAVQAGQTALVV